MKGEPPREWPVRMLEREYGLPSSAAELLIERGMGTIQSPRRSRMAGHPVHVDHGWIRISVPGELNKSVPERPDSEQDNKRFPISYVALQRTCETGAGVDGMPIEEWPQVSRSQAMTFRAANIPTVEALAAVDDAHIDKLGSNARDLRTKAQAFLKLSQDSAAAQEFQLENERLRMMLADQQAQINLLASKLEAQPIGQPAEKPEPTEDKRPGRPKLSDEEADAQLKALAGIRK